jgi:regulator of replication initiation timing
MADLVRSSVEHFISADSMSESESLNDNDVDEIMDSLDQLDSDINKLTTEIKALRQENIESDEMEHLILLKTEEVVERIPEYAPELVDGDNY